MSSSTLNQGTERLWDKKRLSDPHACPDKADRVRRMFERIAPTYRRVNSIASAGRDRAWRQSTVRLANIKAHDRVLDIACGTGDLTEAFCQGGAAEVVGLDFARQMLLRADTRRHAYARCQADALRLPFMAGTFDVTSCAFGVRNFQDLRLGLAEMYRILKPGGRALILEFSLPRRTPLRQLYRLYLTRVLPRLGNAISRDRSGAYCYLPNSVLNFHSPGELQTALAAVGFGRIQCSKMTFGIVHLYRADKSKQPG